MAPCLVLCPGTGKPRCRQGDVLRHGDVIRLLHLNTRKRLHSHE